MSTSEHRVNRGRARVMGLAIVVALGAIAGIVWWATTESPTTQFQNGWNALTDSDLPRVADIARGLSKRRGFESHAHLLRGAYFLRRGQPRESLEELRQALDHDDTRVRAQILAGEALAKLRQSLQAAEVLRQALTTEPDNADAHRWAGVAFYDLGAMQQAVHHLERLAILEPADPRPHRVMGLIYKDLENDQLAVKCYLESLRRSANQPDIESIRTELAEVQIRLNRHEAARATLADCAASARVLALRAECEYALGNLTVAKELLAASLQHDPHETAALLLQGTLALDDGHANQAIASFQQVVNLMPMDFGARFKLSQALAQSGDEARANAELAAMNQIKEVRREAAEVYQQALRQPRDVEARFRLGVLCEKLHRPDLARMWYQAALAIDPAHQPASTASKALDSAATDGH